MKHFTLGSLFISLLVLFILTMSNSSGALPQNTGAPGDQTCGRSSCHNIPANAGSASIAIDVSGMNSTYTPGETKTLTLTLTNSSFSKHGFQILALDANNANAGTWILTAPGETKVVDGISDPSRKYVTHTSGGNLQNSWSLDWEAPANDQGDVTFYVSMIAANGNGTSSGDQLYVDSQTISFEDPINSTANPEGFDIKVFPNPVKNNLFISSSTESIESATIFNSKGKVIESLDIQNTQKTVDMNDYRSGMYFMKLKIGGETLIKPILKL